MLHGAAGRLWQSLKLLVIIWCNMTATCISKESVSHLILLASPAGFEPATCGLEIRTALPCGDAAHRSTKVEQSRVDTRPRPRRFYAKIALDPNRPTPQVSNIAQSILSELDRVRGTQMKLTVDIDAETDDGFPEDVESFVRDNAASLRITEFGFEGE